MPANHLRRLKTVELATPEGVPAEDVDPDVDIEGPVLGEFDRVPHVLLGPNVVQEDSVAVVEKELVQGVELVLPLELARFDDAVVPDDQIVGVVAVRAQTQIVDEFLEHFGVGERVLDVQQPPVEAKYLQDLGEGGGEDAHRVLVFEDLLAYFRAGLELGDQRAQDFHAVAVGGVDPAQRGDGDQVVAEVDEDVDVGPVVERVQVPQVRARQIFVF